MRIAICDDNAEIGREIFLLAKQSCPKAEITLFSAGEELIKEKIYFDIIFLDIEMGQLDGIETAKRLRKENRSGKKSVIIFITAYSDYMEQAFDVNAFHYLLKPVNKEKFIRVFSSALKELESTDPFIVVKVFGDSQKLLLKDIYYIESSNKKAVFHTKKGMLEAYRKMEELEQELTGSFFRCHRCFLVNMESICAYSCEKIKLINGETLILSKKKYPEFVKAYMRYAESGGIVNV